MEEARIARERVVSSYRAHILAKAELLRIISKAEALKQEAESEVQQLVEIRRHGEYVY